ncbi:hypothetical protein [Calidithermus chliarophilus]|uniref:hypothetical protein n=1 Tax=Calidithermus chliarophilus TaxID=52023 RepID=UPI0012F66EFA|nr:hypothetical protein [Calidithermus chliarophilus]
MRPKSFSRFFVFGILLLAGCAPSLMSADEFPIKAGAVWELTLEGPNATSRTFVLRGKPSLDSDYISYDGLAGEDDVLAIYYKNGMLATIVFLEDNKKSFDDRRAIYCFTFKEGPIWAGNGLIGSWARDVEPISSREIRRLPRCELRPK